MILWLDVIPYRMMRVEVATDDAGGSSRNLFRIKVDGLTDGIYWREVVVRDGNPLVSTEPGALCKDFLAGFCDVSRFVKRD